jgi:hypothetical protein
MNADGVAKQRKPKMSQLKSFRISDDIMAYECSKHYSISSFNEMNQETFYDIAAPGEFIIVAARDRAMRVLVMSEEQLCRTFGRAKKGNKNG